MKGATIIIAGGGTGGHVFPAVAVAEAVQRAADVTVVFCGTAEGVEARVVPVRGWALEVLEAEPMKGGGPRRALRGAVVAASAKGSALEIVRRMKPRALLSVGGYASGPVALAAAVLGVPVAVLEPNSVVGLANRMIAPLAKRAYVAWEEASSSFRPGARRLYGVPLREGFVPQHYGPRSVPRILVVGGSQGAAVLNERMPEALALVQCEQSIEVLHQAGRHRAPAVERAYAQAGVRSVRVTAFIEDMPRALADADLVVARAGAGTIAEITAIGRASILVPFPYAAAAHQRKNAEAIARAGAAVCIGQKSRAPRDWLRRFCDRFRTTARGRAWRTPRVRSGSRTPPSESRRTFSPWRGSAPTPTCVVGIWARTAPPKPTRARRRFAECFADACATCTSSASGASG